MSQEHKLPPQDSELLVLRAKEYLNVFQRKNAIADCSAAIKLNGGVAKYYLLRADGYSFLGNDDDALVDYNKALELEPDNAYGHSMRGQALASLEKYETAIGDFDRAHLLILLGEPRLALDDFNKIETNMRKKPNLFETNHSYMASTLSGQRLFLENYLAATEEWDRGLMALPADYKESDLNELVTRTVPRREKRIQNIASMLQLMSPIYCETLEDDDEILKEPLSPGAFAMIEKCIAADHEDVRLYVLQGRMYFTDQQYADAASDFKQASLREPNNANITALKAMTLAMIGNYKQAKTEIEKLIKIKTGDRSTFFLLGLIDYKLRQLDQAVAACSKSIALPGEHDDALILRAAAYHRLHQNDNAFEDIKLLITGDNYRQDFYLERALAYQQIGNKWKANSDLNEAVSGRLGTAIRLVRRKIRSTWGI